MSAKTSDSEAPRKSGRIGKRKVKSGCVTCKIRRIKCDEGKPFCARCTTTGRQCDGYVVQKVGELWHEGKLKEPLFPRFPPVSVLIKFKYARSMSPRILEYPDSTPEELRSLEFFRCKTADKLSRWAAGSFWKYQLPQTGCYEPSIRHFMIAMATIHEEMEISEMMGRDQMFLGISEVRQQSAAQHARLAMSELSKLLAARPEATEIALINCILFVMLDFMVGNFATALLHLHNGQEILNNWGKDRSTGQVCREGSLKDNLAQILHQLSFRTSQDDIDPHAQMEIDNPANFVDLHTARRCLEYLMVETLRIVRIETVIALAKQGSHEKYEVASQRGRLETWSIKFEYFAFAIGGIAGDGEQDDIEDLRVMHMSALIWLEIGVAFEHPDEAHGLAAAIDRAQEMHNTRCRRDHEYLSAHFVFEERLENCRQPMRFIRTRHRETDMSSKGVALLTIATPKSNLQRAGGISSLSDNAVKLAEEKTGPDGRRILEIEVEPTTNEVDLTFLPDLGGGIWEIRTNELRQSEDNLRS